MDLSTLSDDQLRALYSASQPKQPDLSSLSDDQLIALHQSSAPKQASIADDLLHQGKLTARYLVEGPMQLVNTIVGDPAAELVNLGIRGVNALGGNVSPITLPSVATQRTMDRFERPNGNLEEVVGAISRGMTSAAPLVKGAQLVGQGTAQAIPMIRQMAANPTTEILSQGTGGGASEAVKQGGGGGVAQAVAGAIAPMGVGGLSNVARGVASGANELRRPLTQGGAEQIAADTLGRLANNKAAAIENLRKYNDLRQLGDRFGVTTVGVPGSMPTAGAVAGDYGLAAAQQVASRGDMAQDFAKRFAANNEARIADIGGLNATDATIARLTDKRNAITAPLREKAFANAKGPVDFVPVAKKAADLAATAAGSRTESQKALRWIADRIVQNTDNGLTGPEHAYALYQDLGDLVAGKVTDANGASIRLAGGLANEVKKTLGKQIEAAAPGFQNYLKHYANLSKPIERLTALRDRLGGQDLTGVTNAMVQVGPEGGASYTLSQAKVRNAVNALGDANLTRGQSDVLSRVLGDLNAETFASRAGKMPGSDTYQNIASANLLNRVLGGTIAESGVGKGLLARPFNVLYKTLEPRINDTIGQAFLDPRKMEELLRKARTSRADPTLAGILNYTAPRTTAGLLGALIQ